MGETSKSFLPSCRLSLSLLIVWLVASSVAEARNWNPPPRALALDYLQINHIKEGGDVVFLWWVAPPMFERPAEVQPILGKYVIFGIVQTHLAADGTSSFAEISTLQVNDAEGKPLKPLTGDDIPPALAGGLAAMEQSIRQVIGAMGQNMRFFVFEGGSVDACKKGHLSVPYGGETYTYDTPIPGCP